MILSESERKRFIEYCECQILSGKAVAEQMHKINLVILAQREAAKVAAYTTVAKDLMAMESQTIGGERP